MPDRPMLTCRDVSQMSQCGELYSLYADGKPVGLTNEYGTCCWAAGGWTKLAVEGLILTEDGSWRDVEIGVAA
jgi:hypothetical protein